jgi:hypothetical protein
MCRISVLGGIKPEELVRSSAAGPAPGWSAHLKQPRSEDETPTHLPVHSRRTLRRLPQPTGSRSGTSGPKPKPPRLILRPSTSITGSPSTSGRGYGPPASDFAIRRVPLQFGRSVPTRQAVVHKGNCIYTSFLIPNEHSAGVVGKHGSPCI